MVEDEIARFSTAIEEYLSGELDEDVFRVTRLTQGIYGQRQGGTNQMVRVRIPYGKVTPEQLEAFARGRTFECFGPGYERAETHTRTPAMSGGTYSATFFAARTVSHASPFGSSWK